MKGCRTALVLAALLSVALAGCSVGVAVKPDPNTGYIVSNGGNAKKANVTVSKAADVAAYKDLVLVTAGDFAEDQTRNLAFFSEVIDIEELQKRIVAANLQDKVPTVNDRIGLSNAARHYRKFLWLRYDTDKRGSKIFGRLIVTDPVTLDDLFVAERELDYVWAGVNDQNTFYPMFNSLIDWLRQPKS